MPFNPSSAVFRRDIVDFIGGWPGIPNLEDGAMLRKIFALSGSKIMVIPDVVGQYLVRSEGITETITPSGAWKPWAEEITGLHHGMRQAEDCLYRVELGKKSAPRIVRNRFFGTTLEKSIALKH